MKSFTEFADERILDGDKTKVDDIINQEVIINGYNIKQSQYKEKQYLTLQIILNEKKFVLFTGSEVLIDQLTKYKDEIPFKATIRKINKYYSLT
jgi:hypothetical protein